MSPVMFLIYGISCFILMTAVHEFGHWLVAKIKGLNPNFFFKTYPLEIGVEFEDSNEKDEAAVYVTGIIFGFLVIFMFAVVNEFYILMIIPYLFGIQSDAKKLWKLRKHLEVDA